MAYGKGAKRQSQQGTNKNMGRAAPVNPSVSSPGMSKVGGHPDADFNKAGGNVVTSSAPANYKAGKKK